MNKNVIVVSSQIRTDYLDVHICYDIKIMYRNNATK